MRFILIFFWPTTLVFHTASTHASYSPVQRSGTYQTGTVSPLPVKPKTYSPHSPKANTALTGQTLPFTCPNSLPEGVTNGFDPKMNLDRVDQQFYAQFRAALALVPCDATPIRVFPEDSTGLEDTVSVLYVYDSTIELTKKWLKEKYNAESYTNPIRDAVINQCPELNNGFTAQSLKSIYTQSTRKSLSGDEILDILCQQNCTLNNARPEINTGSDQPAHNGRIQTSKCKQWVGLSENTGAMAQWCNAECTHSVHSHLGGNCKTHCVCNDKSNGYYSKGKRSLQYASPSSSYVQYSPVKPANVMSQYYSPQTVAYFSAPAMYQAPYSTHQNYKPYPPTYNAKPESHYPANPTRFDDAPSLIYGTATRTITFFSCEGANMTLCDDLDVVQCKQPRFSSSECDNEWIDCVEEREQYLRDRTDFYDSCYQVFDFRNINIDIENVSADKCFANRLCVGGQLRDLDEPFVGFDPDNDCTCNKKEPVYHQNYYTSQRTRYTRQTDERTSKTQRKYVIRAANGSRRGVDVVACKTRTGRGDGTPPKKAC